MILDTLRIARDTALLLVASGVPADMWGRKMSLVLGMELGCTRCVPGGHVAAAPNRLRAAAGSNLFERSVSVRFFVADALAGPFPDGYDAITCSLYLHHLDREQAVD